MGFWYVNPAAMAFRKFKILGGIALLGLTVFSSLNAQLVIIGGPDVEEGYSMVQTSDGGYAIVGLTTPFDPQQGDWNVYVVKLNGSGNLQWAKAIGGSGREVGFSIVQTDDGGYAISGYIGSGPTDIYVIDLDESGNVQWAKAIGGPGRDEGYSIIQTADGGYAIVGSTSSFGQGGSDVYVLKLDRDGNIQWARTIGGASHDVGYSIIQTFDGGYAIVGSTSSFGQGVTDVYVVKLDSSGNLEWTKTIGGADFDLGKCIIQTSDGGYAISGFTGSFGQGNYDVYVVKLDGLGNLEWTKTIGGENWDEGRSIIQTSDGGYLVAGFTTSFGQGNSDIYVMKLDGSGNLQWTRTIGSAGNDEGQSVVQTFDGDYVVAGSNGWYLGSVFVMKLDVNGNVNVGDCGGVVSDSGMVSSGGDTLSGGVIAFVDSSVVSDIGHLSSQGPDSVRVCNPFTGVISQYNENSTCSVIITENVLRINCLATVRQIRFFGVDGRKYLDVKLNKHLPEIDLSGIPRGIYWVEMRLEDGSVDVAKVTKMW